MVAPPDTQNERTWDVIIIGAGINGAGIARDAAMRGLSVLLLEKADIAGGTSSWSTRLIHGGLRYLEYGEVGLVRESLREREHLLHTAPHLVKPLPLVIPIYRGARHGRLMVRMGMIAYDILSFDRTLDHHHMLSRQQTLQRVPGLNSTDLRGAAIYYDAQIEYAERLVVENVLSAQKYGATVMTGAEVKQLAVEGNRVVGVEYLSPGGPATVRARGQCVVNVAGPWVDQVLRMLGRELPRLVGGTKGSHIVVDPFPGAPAEGLYAEAVTDRRPFFILPWNNRYLIGTTDIRFEGNLDQLAADEEEIDYLIRETNRVIPSAHLARDSVLYTYSGVRPLPHIHEGEPGAITRRHIVHDHAADGLEGMISIVGGKLTTYRSLAEKAVDTIVAKLGRKTIPCSTRKTPLPGANGAYERFITTFRQLNPMLSEKSADHLLRIYGLRAKGVLELAQSAPDLMAVFDEETGAIAAEVLFAVREEMAVTLSDILLRRTMVGLGPNVGVGADEHVAAICRRHLGWDPQRAEQEVAAYRKDVERFHPRILNSQGTSAVRAMPHQSGSVSTADPPSID